MKTKIYLDCSVFGGYYDEEFKKNTRLLFEKIENEEFKIYISDTLEKEINSAPLQVQKLLDRIPQDSLVRVEANEEAFYLANEYINRKIISRKHFEDTLHIATATVSNVSVLVSWNFKHIVNFNRIRGYNNLNAELGYRPIQIISPSSIIY